MSRRSVSKKILGSFFIFMGLSGCALKKQYAQEWTAYQYDEGHSGFVLAGADPPLELKWKFKTKGRVVFSPVVQNDRVYISSRDGYLYALNIEGGTVDWKKNMGSGGGFQSPFIQNGQVYTAQYGLYYFIHAWQKKDGEKLWQYKTGELIDRPPQMSGNHKLLCFNEDPDLSAKRDIKSVFACVNSKGQVLWRSPLKGKVKNLPSLTDKHIFVTSTEPDSLLSLDPKNGQVKWQSELVSAPKSTPLIDRQKRLVYVITKTGYLYAYHFNGKMAWRYQFSGKTFVQDMALSEGTLFIPATDRYLYTFNIKTLEPGWKHRGRGALTAPVVTSDFVYIASQNRRFYILDIKTGRLRWAYNTQGDILAPPVLYEDKVIIGSSDGFVYLFQSQKRKEKKLKQNPLNERF